MKRRASRSRSRVPPDAALVIVGKEIVTGHCQDANVIVLARYLGLRGITVREIRMVSDDERAIEVALKGCRAALIVVTGGLGNTRDDITARVVARGLGQRLVVDRGMRDRARAKIHARGGQWTARHEAFARRPSGARPLENPVGLAEGLLFAGDRKIVLLPGVPAELESILASSLGGALASLFGEVTERRPHVVGVAGLKETQIEDACLDLAPFQKGQVSILPSTGIVQLVFHGDDLLAGVKQRLGSAVFTTTGKSLEAVVINQLRAKKLTLATAESCTGGLLGAALTSVAGASDVYCGGVVAYHNGVKQGLLGVSKRLLERHGAVSGPVAEQMARGARARVGADWALAVTGIAGPGGGSTKKPVGLVFIAAAGPHGVLIERLRLGGSRMLIRRQAVQRALNLIRLAISD